MIVLDTNVLSELQKQSPHGAVEAWFRKQDVDAVYLCAPALSELSFGAEKFLLKTGSSRHMTTLERTIAAFANRVLVLDLAAGRLCGVLRARLERGGRQIAIGDAMIAAICLVHGATLATRNVRDFEGLDLKLVNPFEPVG